MGDGAVVVNCVAATDGRVVRVGDTARVMSNGAVIGGLCCGSGLVVGGEATVHGEIVVVAEFGGRNRLVFK